MTLPNFLGIGVPRAGTTWLHELLQSHPAVYVPRRRKEVSFFDLHYDRGVGWYEKFFPSERQAGRYRAIGEITPYYCYCPECPARIAGLGIRRLVLMLRNPVERAWSYYGQKVRNGMFRGTFEDFLDHSKWPVVSQGQYSRFLQRYFEHFERREVLVLIFEHAMADIHGTKHVLAEFLGVNEDGFTLADAQQAVNPSYMPRAPRLYGLAFRVSKLCRQYDLDWVVNTTKRLGIRELFGAVGKIPPIQPATREQLQDLFRPEILELEKLLATSLDVWRSPAAPAAGAEG
jgi:hypothetical protein